MAHAATPILDTDHALRAQAAWVLAVTARAWALAPGAAQAFARRTPVACEPGRARWRAAAVTALRPATVQLAHSW